MRPQCCKLLLSNSHWHPAGHGNSDMSKGILTHWGRDKMAAVSQTTLSNAFSWMKMLEFRISIKISLKFVPKGPINNIPSLVQIMAWRRSGDKPLSEPMMVCLPTHICVTRPQWVNLSPPGQNGQQFGRRYCQIHFLNENDRISIQISLKRFPYTPIDNKLALVREMAWHRTGDKPLSEPMAQFIDAYMRHNGEMSWKT